MGKTLADHLKGAASASTPALVTRKNTGDADAASSKPKQMHRRYTFSVLECDPISPKTPALVGESWKSKSAQDSKDLVISVPAMLDTSFIMMQSRMDPIMAALREDPNAFDPDDHRMEYDMLNSVSKTVQNIAYHINKLVRSLSKKDDKSNRPADGMDGLDLISGLRGAISRCQEGCKRLAQLVKNNKKMYGHETTKDVLGDEGMMILEQIETAMTIALTKTGKLVDVMDASKKNRAKGLLQKSAAAFLQIQADKGSKRDVLQLHFVAWKDAIKTLKEEREAEN